MYSRKVRLRLSIVISSLILGLLVSLLVGSLIKFAIYIYISDNFITTLHVAPSIFYFLIIPAIVFIPLLYKLFAAYYPINSREANAEKTLALLGAVVFSFGFSLLMLQLFGFIAPHFFACVGLSCIGILPVISIMLITTTIFFSFAVYRVLKMLLRYKH